MALRYENEVSEIIGYDGNGVKLAYVQFPAMNSDTVDVEHMKVDPSLQGQGVDGELMEQPAKRLRDERKKAVLTCPYVQHWFDGYPENKDLAAEQIKR